MVGLLVVWTLLTPAVARADTTINDPRIRNAGGLAADPERGIYWTANADEPGVLYQVDPAGQVVGTVSYPAHPAAVEALAMHAGALYVADIGAPGGGRTSVNLLRLTGLNGTPSVAQFHFSYPDGAHDAAAIMISPRGNLYLITREQHAQVYRAAIPASVTNATIDLEQVGPAPSWVTDATYLTTSDQMVLRTYTGILVLDAWTLEVTAQGPLPNQPQGESITASLTGTGLVVGTKGSPSTLLDVALPTGVTPLPPAPATPPGAASPSPTEAGTSASPSGDGSSPPSSEGASPSPSTSPAATSRTGLWGPHTSTAILTAVVLSLAAGGVSALHRRRP
jgi:hypothetical protein